MSLLIIKKPSQVPEESSEAKFFIFEVRYGLGPVDYETKILTELADDLDALLRILALQGILPHQVTVLCERPPPPRPPVYFLDKRRQ